MSQNLETLRANARREWQASPALQVEFESAESFAAYQAAIARGRVKFAPATVIEYGRPVTVTQPAGRAPGAAIGDGRPAATAHIDADSTDLAGAFAAIFESARKIQPARGVYANPGVFVDSHIQSELRRLSGKHPGMTPAELRAAYDAFVAKKGSR